MTFYQHQQRRKAYYIPLCVAGKISIRKCARVLNVSPVTICDLKKRYKLKGDDAFVNGHKNQHYNLKKYSDELRQEIVHLYVTYWDESPFATFHENLSIYHNIVIPYHVVRKILLENGFKPPRSWSTKEKIEHKRRKERQHFGELVQMDASTHDWFMTGELSALHGGIDDATHIVLGLYFCRNECRLGYNEVLRQTWKRYGVPRSYYIDRHSSFVRNSKKKGRTFTERVELSKNEHTHFVDLCNLLDIEVILALSAQGKGRIERLWQTLQGKLPYLFRFLGINTLEAANDFLSDWVDSFNAKYSIPAMSDKSYFRPVSPSFDFDYQLSIKFNMRTDSMGCFTFHDCDFRLNATYKACKSFELCLSEQYGIRAYMQGKWYTVSLVNRYLQDVRGDKMTQVEKDLIARYLLRNIHTDYA